MLLNERRNVVEEIVKKFESKYEPEPNSGCWLWTGGIDITDAGISYGYMWLSHTKKVRAHRFSYELYKGKIPLGFQIRHMCHNSLCVNPNHLDVGTSQDNMNDKVKAGRQAKGRKHGRSQKKFTEEQVIYIRESKKRNKDLAEEFKVNPASISRIKHYENWSWLS